MKISFLDTEAFYDLSFDKLCRLGEVALYRSSDRISLADKVRDADVIVSNGAKINEEVLNNTNAKYICLSSTGYDNVDLELCRSRGVHVSNIPGYGTEAVAQLTILHILNLYNKFYEYVKETKDGLWNRSSGFSKWKSDTHQLKGKTLGIIGYGAIGRRTGELAEAFGMKLITYSLRVDSDFYDFLRSCDIVSIHLPYNEETKDLFTEREFDAMKESAFLICTSRGGIINEGDLYTALKEGKIRGAGLDVLSVEPPEDNRLSDLPNCYITPHIGWALQEAREQAMEEVYENILAYSEGRTKNLIV